MSWKDTFRGIMFGEGFLVVALLDIVRGKWMASFTGLDTLKWICPFGQLMSWISWPVWQASQSPNVYEQPIRLFAMLGLYWATIGAVVFQLILLVWRKRSKESKRS